MEFEPGIVWISWEEHRRTRGICEALRIELRVVMEHGGWWRRYPRLVARTYFHLLRERRRVLIVQNPSIVLTTLAVLLRVPLGYKLAVDAHNEAIAPYIHTSWLVMWLARRLVRAADLTIVTNERLAEKVEALGGRSFVLADRIPDAPHSLKRSLSDRFNIVLISTFADDEPTEAVFEAASHFVEQITLYVTGKRSKLKRRYPYALPKNVKSVGYLSENDYWEFLNSVDAVIDLTMMDDCLVCGAYEALGASKPLILSDSAAAKEYFRETAIYVKNDVDGISSGFREILRLSSNLQESIQGRKRALNSMWQSRATALMQLLS